MWVARRNEALLLMLVGSILFVRYPVQFAISPPYLMDFNVYRTVADRVIHGQTQALYFPTTLDSERMVFKYAPPWAFCWVPLAWLPAQAAAVVWTCINVLALLVTLMLCGRLCRIGELKTSRWTGLIAVVAVLLITTPLNEEIGNGQANLLWGALVTGFILAMMLRRPWLAAALLSGAILLKLPAAIFLPYLVLRRQWGVCWRAAVIGCGATLIASTLLMPQAPLRLVAAWGEALFHNGTTYAFEISNQSLLALFGRLFTRDGYGLNVLALPRALLFPIAAAIIAVATILTAARRVPDHPARWLFDSAILVILMVIGSPSSWPATYTALVWPLFLSLAIMSHQVTSRRWDVGSLVLAVLALICNALTHRKYWDLLGLRDWHGEGYLFLVFMTLPLMALCVLGLLVRHGQLAAVAPELSASTSHI